MRATRERNAERFRHKEVRPPGMEEFGIWSTDLEVCKSGAGFYVGTKCWNEEYGGFIEPYSRDSEYMSTRQQAEERLKQFQDA